MSKPIKAMITADLRERYLGFEGACVVDLTGLNVAEQEQLRGALREKDARLEVVKNALAKASFKDTPLEAIGQVLEGPCALVTCSASLIETAKVLVKAAKDFDNLKLKQAKFDAEGDVITVEELSKMLGREELLGQIAMLISSPGRALAGCLGAPQSRIAGCLKTIAEKAA